MDVDPNIFIDLVTKGGLAAGVIWWFARRDDRNRDSADTREKSAAERCAKDNASLLLRLQQVEDRHYAAHNDILFAAAQALEVNARAFAKLSDIETDRFPAVKPREQP